MKFDLKRALSGVAAVAVAAGIAPLLSATPALAAGELAGAATIRSASGAALLQSGDSATTFTLRLPTGAACDGDSPNDGYRWQAYMVSGAIDPSTLTFNGSGPIGLSSGTHATFKQPLYTTGGSPVTNQQTPAADPAPGPGPILNIPDMNLSVFTPGDIPAGVYNLGIACTLGPAGATQMRDFWNVQMTVATAAPATGGPAQITWNNGKVPGVPAAVTATAQPSQVTVSWTAPANPNPAITGYTVELTDTTTSAVTTHAAGSGATSLAIPATNGDSYTARVRATNNVGDGAYSAATTPAVTPRNSGVTGFTAVGEPEAVRLTWIDVAADPATYDLSWAPGGGAATLACPAAPGGTCSHVVTGLNPGTLYTFTIGYGTAGTSETAQVTATPLSNTIVFQDLTVSRPNGALVLTQVCGKYGSIPAEGATEGFPGGFVAETANGAPGTAPFLSSRADTTAGSTTVDVPGGNPAGLAVGNAVRGAVFPAGTTVASIVDGDTITTSSPATATATNTELGLGILDEEFPEYPYPDVVATGASDANFPTHCGIALGAARFVTQGPGAGKWFAASARLNEVTIVDTRDTDPGWSVNFTMSNFTAGAGKTFSGDQLGWTVETHDTDGFVDGDGNAYDQKVNGLAAADVNGAAGANDASYNVVPNTDGGAGTSHVVARVPSGTDGLGIATLNARLKLLIPVWAQNGEYSGQLTINAV